MLEGFKGLFNKKKSKKEQDEIDLNSKTKEAAKERLHLVLMQDRANVSVDFLDMMKQEIIDVIKKYIDVDESEMDVRITNKINEDGTNGAPALYANIPIISIRNDNTVKKVAGMKIEEIKKMEKNSENKNEKQIKKENKEQGAVIVKETTKKNSKVEAKSEKVDEKPTKKDDELKNVKEKKQLESKKVAKVAKTSAKSTTSSASSKKTASKKDINKKTAISKK